MNHRLLVGYYAATVLFLVLDAGFGVNLRIAFLDAFPLWRAAWYAVCFACLVLVIRRPDWEAVVAGVESLFVLSGLIIDMAIRSMPVGILPADGGYAGVTVEDVVNFLISGSVAYMTWTRGMRAFREKL